MTATNRLTLPYIASQQAQKQVVYNEAMTRLDQLIQLVLESTVLATPPDTPATGAAWAVPNAATGAWADRAGQIAGWDGAGWTFVTPARGWLAYVVETSAIVVFDGAGWIAAIPNGPTLKTLGVNTSADATTRLAVATEAALFTHVGNSQRLLLNKAAASDTASLILENNYAGRAEIGLTGDDALHVKVSSDGSTWQEALTVGSTGQIALPRGQIAFPSPQNASTQNNVLDDYREGSWLPYFVLTPSNTILQSVTNSLAVYTKIGRLVVAHGHVQLISKPATATGTLGITMPFTAIETGQCAVAVAMARSFTGITGTINGNILPNTSRIMLSQMIGGTSSYLTEANLASGCYIFFSACFTAAS